MRVRTKYKDYESNDDEILMQIANNALAAKIHVYIVLQKNGLCFHIFHRDSTDGDNLQY